MAILSPSTTLIDDVLSTIFCEVENLVNSRPLTKCSDDSNDNRPLIPNHLLLLQGNTPIRGVSLTRVTSTGGAGVRCSTSSVFSGKGGSKSIYLNYNDDKNGCQCRKNIKVGDLVFMVDELSFRGIMAFGSC